MRPLNSRADPAGGDHSAGGSDNNYWIGLAGFALLRRPLTDKISDGARRQELIGFVPNGSMRSVDRSDRPADQGRKTAAAVVAGPPCGDVPATRSSIRTTW